METGFLFTSRTAPKGAGNLPEQPCGSFDERYPYAWHGRPEMVESWKRNGLTAYPFSLRDTVSRICETGRGQPDDRTMSLKLDGDEALRRAIDKAL